MGLRLAIRGGQCETSACAWHSEGCLCCPAAARRRPPTIRSAPFELLTLPGPGRTAFAEIVDLDGDGRGDVVTASFTRLPPDQRRTLRVHFQREDGSLPEKPDWTAPLPDGAAAYDFVPHAGRRGRDALHATRSCDAALARRPRRRSGATSRCPERRSRSLPTSAASTGCVSRATGSAAEPLLVVPGLGEVFVSTLDGEIKARLATQSRANFFVPPRPGLLITDNEADLYFEHPRIDVADVDGDGRGDLVVSNRHEVLVFLGREAGGFAAKPDQRHVLRRLSETDLVRATGSARVEARDWNGDGRADLLVSATRGGLLHAPTRRPRCT